MVGILWHYVDLEHYYLVLCLVLCPGQFPGDQDRFLRSESQTLYLYLFIYSFISYSNTLK